TDPRKRALAALLAFRGEGIVSAGVHLALNPSSLGDVPGVLRIQNRLAIVELLVSEDEAAIDRWDAAEALAALEQAWRAANAAGVRLRSIGFARTRYVHLPIDDPASSCDEALLETVRRGIPLASARAGIR